MIAGNLLKIGVALAVVGMGAGIIMGMAHDFALAPAHAHLNLVGYVSLFLAGLYYKQHPEAARRTLATLHAWVAVIGAVAFPVGLALVLHFGESCQPFVIIGSFIAFLGMLLFAFVVWLENPRAA